MGQLTALVVRGGGLKRLEEFKIAVHGARSLAHAWRGAGRRNVRRQLLPQAQALLKLFAGPNLLVQLCREGEE